MNSSSKRDRGKAGAGGRVGVAERKEKRELFSLSSATIKCDNSIQTIKQFSQNVETTRQAERVRGRGSAA